MDAKLLQRVMDLAEKTGDRVIIVNPKTGAAHAVVPFDAYEKMAEGSASLHDLENDESSFIDLGEIEDEVLETHSAKDDGRIGELLAERMEEIEKREAIEDFSLNKAQTSQKEASGLTSLDVLDDEANEEQYYLEPLE